MYNLAVLFQVSCYLWHNLIDTIYYNVRKSSGTVSVGLYTMYRILYHEIDMNAKLQDRSRRCVLPKNATSHFLTAEASAELCTPYEDVHLQARAIQIVAQELLPTGYGKIYRSPRRMLMRPYDHREEDVNIKDEHGTFRPIEQVHVATVAGTTSRPRRQVKVVNYKV